MWKLTSLTIWFVAGLALAPAAGAAEPFTQVSGAMFSPMPQEQRSECDPNYSSPCVPIASDVDCASGSGNGPAYVSGPVTVSGDDIYDLDRDGNGVGCE